MESKLIKLLKLHQDEIKNLTSSVKNLRKDVEKLKKGNKDIDVEELLSKTEKEMLHG